MDTTTPRALHLTASGQRSESEYRYSLMPVELRGVLSAPVSGQAAALGSRSCVQSPLAPSRAGRILDRLVDDDCRVKHAGGYEEHDNGGKKV